MFSQKNYPISIRLPPLRFMKSQRWEATSLQAVWKDWRCFWRHFSWRVCSRAQVCHHRIASPSSGISNSRNVYLCQWHGMFRNERTVDFIETFFLPMSSLAYDSSLWSVGAQAELNLERGDQLYLQTMDTCSEISINPGWVANIWKTLLLLSMEREQLLRIARGL